MLWRRRRRPLPPFILHHLFSGAAGWRVFNMVYSPTRFIRRPGVNASSRNGIKSGRNTAAPPPPPLYSHPPSLFPPPFKTISTVPAASRQIRAASPHFLKFIRLFHRPLPSFLHTAGSFPDPRLPPPARRGPPERAGRGNGVNAR